jgi:RimJ/RimL family protein N-acetyltransferase
MRNHVSNDRASDLKSPKRNVRIDCGKYLIRTLKPDDASDRFASWMCDSDAIEALNLRPQRLSKSDLAIYIKGFDQWSRLLLGVFEKESGMHIGIIRLDVDYRVSRAHVSMLIGEADYRNKGVTADVIVSALDHVFERAGLAKMTASVLARNKLTLGYLLKAGWQIDNAAAHSVRSNADGTMLELRSLSLTGDAWRAWKSSDTASRLVRRVSTTRKLAR